MKFHFTFPVERQMDLMDCGPACLKAIAKYYNKYYSLQFLREKCGISREGVSLLDLSYGAENIGLKSLCFKASIEDLHCKVPLPCIIHWNKSHFIVVYKVTKTKVYISDPAKGLLQVSWQEFVSKWYLDDTNGTLLALEPQAHFYQINENEKLDRRKTFENILGYFLPYKKSFVNLFIVMLIVTCLQGLLPFISKAVIDVGIQTHDLNFIDLVLVANIVIVLSVTLSNSVRDWILLHITSRINVALISDYLMKLMKLPISFFDTKLTGDILQRANDLERIRSFILNNSISLIFSSLTFVVFGIILLVFNKFIFYTFLIGSTIYVLWVFAFFRIRKKLDWQYFELVSKNQSYWVETIDGMQDIKINNYEKAKRWKWEDIQAKLYHVNVRSLSINNFQNLGAQFIDQLKNLLITFFCAKAVIRGEISFGVMISTQFIIGMLNGPVNQFIQFVISAQMAQISFLRLNEIHQLRDEDEDIGVNSLDLVSDEDMVIKNLGFQYSRNSNPIFRNLNLIIPKGKVTAFVGDSGSGKSTLLKLLLRLYNPTYGEILIGSMNLNNIGLKQWRDKCGAVMQDGKIFNDSILNNIILDDENPDLKKLKAAVDTANIAEEIESMPLGYQTILGEMGRGISGGQKQRILIARALYKTPDYLFFDEATNALDTINEQKIVSALEKIFFGKTVIVVAHRLSTIRSADQIVVLKNGAIAEIGNHEYLMTKQGHYFDLVNTQNDLFTGMFTPTDKNLAVTK